MSSIEELKDGTTSIDMTQQNQESNKVDMATGNAPTTHTRESFDPREIMPEKEEAPHEPTILENILEGPNSMLGKYIEQKSEEMEERLSTFEEEKEAVEEGLSNKVDEDDAEDKSSLISGNNLSSDLEDPANYNIETEDFGKNVDSSSVTPPSPIVESPSIDVEVSTLDSEVENNNDLDEDDIENESDSHEVEDESEETLKHLQALATERLKPISKSLDISSFTIVKKASMNSNLIKKPLPKAAKWVLMSQESIVLMKEFSGPELQALQEYSEAARSLTSLTQRYRLIYDHILSPKPAFEAWLKVTPYSDIDHYFFAIYIGSYKGANYLPKDCKDPKCKETYLTDNVDIMAMTKFESEEVKAKFMQIYHNETVYPNTKGIYVTEIVPVSENLAVSFRSASIYSLFEVTCLDDNFREKYNDIINTIPYIDSFYTIDAESKSLIPVGYKEYPENATKTVKSKIKKFAECLRTLTSDEFSLVKSFTNELRRKELNNGLTYRYPSSTCPKCGKEDKEIAVTAEEAVFTRYQLGALVNTSLN